MQHPRFITLGLALNLGVLSCNSMSKTSSPTSEQTASFAEESAQEQEADPPCDRDESARAMSPSIQRSSRRIEAELDSWEQPCQDTYVPSKSALDPETDIVGEWSTETLFEGAFLTVTRTGQAGDYCVRFGTYGCTDGWELQRSGKYSSGCLRLNRAVRENPWATYDRLYAVRIAGEERLLASGCSDDIDRLLRDTNRREDAAAVRTPMLFRKSEVWEAAESRRAGSVESARDDGNQSR